MITHRFAIIDNGIVNNIIISSKDYAEKNGMIYVGKYDISVGDKYDIDENKFICIRTEYVPIDEENVEERIVTHTYDVLLCPDKATNKEQREYLYETMIYKMDGTSLINFDGCNLTVDEANDICLKYIAEGNEISKQIQTLISEAKSYIRELFPD